jgi:RDD family protein
MAFVALLSCNTAAAAPATPATSSQPMRGEPVVVTRVGSITQERFEFQDFGFNRRIVRVGQSYSLGEAESVREIHSGLADITIAGTVEYDVVVIVGSLHLTNTAKIGGNVLVIGGTLTIDSGASVARDMIVAGGNLDAPATFTPGGEQVIIGTIGIAHALRGLVPWVTRGLLYGRPIVPDLWWMWPIIGVFLFVYVMVHALFSRHVATVADTVSARPLSSFLLGLLAFVLIVPAIAILAATGIGILVVPFVLCAILVAALIGKAGVMRATGRTVLAEDEDAGRTRALVSVLIGFAVLTIAYMIPVLGFITWAITGAIGFGGATTAFRAALRREQPPRMRAPLPVEPVAAAEPLAAASAEPAYAAPVAAFAPDPAIAADAASGAIPPPPPLSVPGDLAVYPRAAFLDRVAAFAIDAILVGIAVNLLDLERHDGSFPLLLLAYHVAFWAWRGTTLGGIIVGLRLVRVHGTDLRFADALVRGLTAVFSIAALGIGCFWMINDPEKQMWHDKIAGTLVVKVPRHLVLP